MYRSLCLVCACVVMTCAPAFAGVTYSTLYGYVSNASAHKIVVHMEWSGTPAQGIYKSTCTRLHLPGIDVASGVPGGTQVYIHTNDQGELAWTANVELTISASGTYHAVMYIGGTGTFGDWYKTADFVVAWNENGTGTLTGGDGNPNGLTADDKTFLGQIKDGVVGGLQAIITWLTNWWSEFKDWWTTKITELKEWYTNLWTGSDDTQSRYQAALSDLKTAGPWGMADQVKQGLQRQTNGLKVPLDTWMSYGVKDPKGTLHTFRFEDMPTNNHTFDYQKYNGISGGGEDGSAPWNNNLDFASWQHTLRSVLFWGTWAFVGIAVLLWLRGNNQV